MADEIAYDTRAGQYRGANGRFVPREQVQRFVDQEIRRTQIRLQAQTRLLVEGKLDIPAWQMAMAGLVKDSHLRMAALGSGGKDQLDARQYGAVGYQLKRQYQFLDQFAQDLADGKLTPERAIWRSGLYASSVKQTFSRTEQLSREREGFTVGKRLLDAQAQHCPECIGYERPDWVAIADIMPVGTNCSCQNFCKCRIVYARMQLSDVLA